MRDLAAAAATFALAHIAVFAAGAYVLSRVLGCRRDVALLAALVAPTSEWIFYWGAGDWIPALTSIAWAPWAWAGLTACARDARWTPAAAAGVALVLLSGWPFADLALLISILVVGAAGGRLPRAAPVLAIVCGGLMAAPAILPLGFYLGGAARPPSPMLAANLDALIGVSTPFMVTRWLAFGGVRDTAMMPMLQIAWFVAPALATAGWRGLWRRAEVRALVLTAATFATLSVMPGLWQFRWMFRFLPYYQLALALLAALAIDEALRTGRSWRLAPVALALGGPLWLALWQDGRMTGFYLLVAAALALLAALVLRLQPRRAAPFVAVLALGHAALFAVVNIAYLGLGDRYPAEIPLPDRLPDRVEAAGELALTRYTVFELKGSPAHWAFFRPGDSALERPGVTINGYSPLHLAPYDGPLCLSAFGSAQCPDAVERLSRPFAGTGRAFLDLARVEEVRAQAGAYAESFAQRRPDWIRQPGPEGAGVFRRPLPLPLPAPVSLAPADARIEGVAAAPREVRFTMASRTGGRVILARAWYPGWRVTLDGRALPVRPVGGVFVATDLPPNSHGVVTFTYWPKGLTLGIAAAGGAVLLLAGGTGVIARRERRSLAARPSH
jgi:hypothetical protein